MFGVTLLLSTHRLCILVQRRKLHNDIMELKGNIRVLCRIRPLGAAGRETRSVVSVVNESQLTLDDEDRGKKHRFSFAQVFPPGTSQEEVCVAHLSDDSFP